MKVLYIYILCFLFLFACGDKNKSSVSEKSLDSNDKLWIVDLDNSNKGDLFFLSSVFKKVSAIALSMDVQIGRVDKILDYDDFYLILDRNIAKSLFVFNKNGSFVRKIGQFGKGPGEYNSISDFTIDKENAIVYIMDAQTQKISWFSISTGSYINSVRLKNDLIRSFRIQHIDGKMFADAYMPEKYKNKSYLLRSICLKTGVELAHWLPTKDYNKGWSHMFFNKSTVFLDDNINDVKYYQTFMDTVVKIEKNKVYPYIVFKSKDIVTKIDLEKHSNTDANSIYMSLYSKDKIFDFNELFEFDEIIHFTFLKGTRLHTAIFDKNRKKTTIYALKFDDLLYDRNAKSFISPEYMYNNNTQLIAILQHNKLNEFDKLAKDGSLSENMKAIYKDIKNSYDSNPIILVYE